MATEREPETDRVPRREVPNLRAAWRLAREQSRLDDAAALVISLADAGGWRDLSDVRSWARELAADPAIATPVPAARRSRSASRRSAC